MLAWGRGELTAKVPDAAPPGGTNYMSARSSPEAIAGALENAEPGAAYLIGDENLSYRDYFQPGLRRQRRRPHAGGARRVATRSSPDHMIVPGRGAVISYEPDPAVVELLGYRRGDVRPMLEEMARAVVR